jgi:hypothetical protein
MNAFETVITLMNLSHESQDVAGVLWLVCSLGKDNYSGENTFTNPFREAIRRLASYSAGSAYKSFAPILQNNADKFDAR